MWYFVVWIFISGEAVGLDAGPYITFGSCNRARTGVEQVLTATRNPDVHITACVFHQEAYRG